MALPKQASGMLRMSGSPCMTAAAWQASGHVCSSSLASKRPRVQQQEQRVQREQQREPQVQREQQQAQAQRQQGAERSAEDLEGDFAGVPLLGVSYI